MPGKLLWVPEPSCLWPQTEKYEQVPRAALQPWRETRWQYSPSSTIRKIPVTQQHWPLPSWVTKSNHFIHFVLKSSSKKSYPDTYNGMRDGFQLSLCTHVPNTGPPRHKRQFISSTSKCFSYPVHLSTSETCRDVSAQLQINMIGGVLIQDAEASATTLQHSLCQAISQSHEECLRDNEHQLCPRALQNYKIVSISICSAPHPVCLNQRAAQSSNIKKNKNSCLEDSLEVEVPPLRWLPFLLHVGCSEH